MSEGGVTAVEEALRIHPTWINGGGDLPGPGWLGHRRHAGGRQRAVPPRPVLPHGVGVDLRRARPAAGRRRRPGRRADAAVAGAVRRDVGGQLDRHERQPVPPPLRRHPRDARLDRAQRPRQRRPQPGRDLPRPDDDGRLPRRPGPITTPVRPLRLRRARATRSIAVDRVRRRRSPATCPSRRSGSRRSAPRSSSGSRGTRARSPTSPRCSASPPTSGPGPSLRPADVDLALALRRLHLQRHLVARGPRLLRASARRRTGSTAAAASPSTASSR